MITTLPELPDHPFRGYIFDCDGTLVDSMPLHYVAWVEALRLNEAPFDFTEEVFYRHAGVREQDVVTILNGEYDSSVDPDSVAHMKAKIFTQSIPKVEAIQPVVELVRKVHGEAPLSVASGSEEPIVRGCLQATGLIDLFEAIVTPAYVAKGKPAPDMFLLAAEKMGVDPADCLVIEDGQSGLEAAEAAGMHAVFVPRTLR
jgi:beta-phosphoglucomutase family hydrolase